MFGVTRKTVAHIPSYVSRRPRNCISALSGTINSLSENRPFSTRKDAWSSRAPLKSRSAPVTADKDGSSGKQRNGNLDRRGKLSDRDHSGKERAPFANRGKESRGVSREIAGRERGSYAARDNYRNGSERAEFWGENSRKERGSSAARDNYRKYSERPEFRSENSGKERRSYAAGNKHVEQTDSRNSKSKRLEREARTVVEPVEVPWDVQVKPLAAEVEGTGGSEDPVVTVIERPPNDQNHGIEWYRKTSRDREEGDVLFGLSVVMAALETKQRKFKQMWIRTGIEDSPIGEKAHFARIMAHAKDLDIPIRRASGHVIELLAPGRVHQGIILETLPLDPIPLICLGRVDHEGASYDLIPPDGASIERSTYSPPGRVWPIWIALDQVTDPQNFGSIARSAQFFGVDGIVVCHRNSAPRSATASKASTGALEVMDLHVVNHLHTFLKKCSANGWHIIGASALSSEAETDRKTYRPSHISLPKSPVLPNRPTNGPITGPIILVVGSEGEGLRPHVLAECKEIMCIQGSEELVQGRVRVPGMTSLNVGVATGCLLRELTQIRDRPLRAGTPIDPIHPDQLNDDPVEKEQLKEE